MKEKIEKVVSWYASLNTKQRIIIWALSLPYAVFPFTGILMGGIPWALLLLYSEFHRDGSKANDR